MIDINKITEEFHAGRAVNHRTVSALINEVKALQIELYWLRKIENATMILCNDIISSVDADENDHVELHGDDLPHWLGRIRHQAKDLKAQSEIERPRYK